MSPILAPPPYPVSPDELRHAPALTSDGANKSTPDAGEQSFSFSDFLSIINPLQHIPIVGSIYRAITGDTIKPAPRVIGGLLFGGPMGLITSAFNAMVEQTKGKDLGEQALALLVPDKGSPAPAEPLVQHADAALAQKNTEVALPQQQPRPADDLGVAPLSRSLFGFTPTQSSASALGGDRTLASSLRGPGANPAPAAAQGRTIADYRSFSGRPLPVVDTNRSGNTHSAAVRLQPTAPMPEKPRAPAAPSAAESRPSDSASVDAVTDAKAETAPAANPPPTSEWFAAAMSRGLDRYREQRRPAPAATQIDTTL